MIRKVRSSSSGSSKSGSTGRKPSKGGGAQRQPEWEEDAGAGGGDISPRSDEADNGNERYTKENDKSMAGLQSKNYKLAKELVRNSNRQSTSKNLLS